MKHRTTLLRCCSAALVFGYTASTAVAADHRDAPSVIADATSDINDVYAWTEGDDVVLVMTVSPLAPAGAMFSDATQYVFHTESSGQFGEQGDDKDVICTFDAAQTIQCWVGQDDYVTGDASAEAGLTSASGRVKVFAGLRDDPFFFNLDGFKDVAATVTAVAPTLTVNGAGCPQIDAATSTLLVTKLKTDPTSTPPGGPAKDFFAGKNTLAIVISIDKELLSSGGPVLNVWASTNKVGG
ncbi:MAG: DUF4331 family protein [Polyangiaceae bacterium]|nr:DUF4331 family protein [Polyangiaceae bacterium]